MTLLSPPTANLAACFSLGYLLGWWPSTNPLKTSKLLWDFFTGSTELPWCWVSCISFEPCHLAFGYSSLWQPGRPMSSIPQLVVMRSFCQSWFIQAWWLCWGDLEFRFKYMPVLVAIHNDTGLSNKIIDDVFEKNRKTLVQEHLKRKLLWENIIRTGFKQTIRIINWF